ncbi:fatty acid hydroxylase [Klebsiella sp. RIT-PI-d]|uniref:sterol desaturase family protein n=1 Tax=Klebsiella sp. RIT-PI-d TaxID=1681196 RepID=UPI0006760AC7|nr:sterol desaturase family protein [Klebsiella sp. RIT-PI-d]KNC09537.1 fatty acid hydroxylase [Klebsiella sp. RIT-PI-d]
MSELLYPIIFMLLLVLGEACFLHLSHKRKIDWHDIMFNLNSGHIVLWLFRCVEVLCYALVLHYASLSLFDGVAVGWIWLFTLLAWDFCFYWLHRLHHERRWLWAVHVVHHQGEHYNLSLGVRNSWYSSLTGIPFFLVLAVCGVPLSIYLAVSVIHYSIQFFNHNALTPRLGWLEKIFITPSHHRVHHINERRYADTNYGGTFIFWDRLFGTLCKAPPAGPVKYGVKGSQLSANPFRESNLPFQKLARLSAVSSSCKPSSRGGSVMLITGTLLLFMLVLGYIQRYGYHIDALSPAQVLLFLLLATGTVALGGISDGQRWGRIVWCGVTVLCLVYPLLLAWREPLWLIAPVLLVLHALLLMCGVGHPSAGVVRESV